jgi:hypothetical protein
LGAALTALTADLELHPISRCVPLELGTPRVTFNPTARLPSRVCFVPHSGPAKGRFLEVVQGQVETPALQQNYRFTGVTADARTWQQQIRKAERAGTYCSPAARKPSRNFAMGPGV